MTSKERVLKAFANQIPDRVPINYFDNPGIRARLLKHFDMAPDDEEGLLEAFGVDFRSTLLRYTGKPLFEGQPGVVVDPVWGYHTRWIENESGGYWDFCDFPLKDADEEAVEVWPMPSPDDYDYDSVIEQCKKFKKYAVSFGDTGFFDLINTMGLYRSMEQALVDLATDDPVGMRYIDRRLEVSAEITVRVLEKAKKCIDFLWIGEDLGTQIAPMLSLDLFRRQIRPRKQKIVDIAKAYGIPVMIHSCGSSSWAFEDFIDMGISVVDTLQPEAKNMEPGYLKDKFGGRLAFHGCISTAGPLAYGTADDVAANVKETLEIMMPGGGYCLAPTHWIQDNTPVENVIAMYEAASKYGRY